MTQLNRNNSNWSFQERAKINQNWDILEGIVNSTASNNNGVKGEIEELKATVSTNTQRVTQSLQIANRADVKADDALAISNSALNNANSALNEANSAGIRVDEANYKSEEANRLAIYATQVAENIDSKAERAIEIAENIDSKAERAIATSSLADIKATNSTNIANEANAKSEYVQSQLDNIVADGDSNAEVVQARGENDNLRQRLDTEQQKVTTDVFKAFEKSSLVTPQTRKNNRASVLLVDDDMHPNSYSVVYEQIVKGRNLPYTFAAIPSRIMDGSSGSVTYAQFKEMQANPLVTIANHTNTHRNLATLTEQEILEEIRDAEEWLRREGVYTRCLVPPFGGINDNVRKHIKKYCDTALITYNTGGTANLNCANGAILNSDALRRVEFSLPLENLTALADIAKQTNGLFVLSTHSGYSPNESNVQNFSITKLHAFIDYCESIELPFLSYEEAYETFKNVFEHRSVNGTLVAGLSANGDSFGLTSKDFYVGSSLKSINDVPVFGNGPTFSFIKRSYNTTNANINGYPGAGQLLTTTGGDYGYTFELYQPLRTRRLLFRSFNDQTQTWSDFNDIASTLNLRGTALFSATQYPEIAVEGKTRLTITANGVLPGDSVIVNPETLPPAGVMWQGLVQSDGQIIISILNMSNTAYSVNGTRWIWRAIRTL